MYHPFELCFVFVYTIIVIQWIDKVQVEKNESCGKLSKEYSTVRDPFHLDIR